MTEKYTLSDLMEAANNDSSWEEDADLRAALTEYLVMSAAQ